MNRQSVMAFGCHSSMVAKTVMKYAGGFEIASVSHDHLVGTGGMVSVVLVIHGPVDQLRDHETKVAEFLAHDVITVA